MADSLRETAVAALKTTLQTITTVGGYETNLGSNVFLWKGGDWQDGELDGADIRDVADDIEGASVSTGVNRERHRVRCEIFVLTDADAAAQRVRKMIADVYKAIGADRTLGGAVRQVMIERKDEMHVVQNDKIRGEGKIEVALEYDSGLYNPYA